MAAASNDSVDYHPGENPVTGYEYATWAVFPHNYPTDVDKPCTESVFSSTKFVKVTEKLIYLHLCRNSSVRHLVSGMRQHSQPCG